MAMPVMVEGMAKRMFPTPAEPVEPDMFDRVGKILEIPAVNSIVEKVGNMSEAFAISKMQPPRAKSGESNTTAGNRNKRNAGINYRPD